MIDTVDTMILTEESSNATKRIEGRDSRGEWSMSQSHTGQETDGNDAFWTHLALQNEHARII